MRTIDGCPMFIYALKAAISAGCFSRICVSTDDAEIAESAAEVAGVSVDIRPASMRGDHLSSPQVIAELVERLGGAEEYTTASTVSPCAPLVRPWHVRRALGVFLESDASSLESVVQARYHPKYAMTLERGTLVKPWGMGRVQTNEDGKQYFGNGVLYVAKTAKLLKYRSFAVPPIVPYEMGEAYSFDVNYESDLIAVAAQMRRLKATGELTQ